MQYKTLLVGVGNPLRGDDAAGIEAAAKMAAYNIPQLEVITLQQLDVALIDKMRNYDQVIITDASVTVNTVTLDAVSTLNSGTMHSHHADAALLYQLMQQLYGKTPIMMLCQIPAVDFTIGNSLSKTAVAGVDEAVRKMLAWLQR